MTSAPRQGSHLAPPHIVISLSAPSAEVHLAPHLLQAVAIEEAAVDDNDLMLEYWIEAEEFPEVAANTVVIHAQTQYSRPSSRPGSAAASLNPLVGIRIASVLEAVITSATPVYQAPRRSPPPSQTPPPLYADSAPRVRRRPPPSLLVQRPRTRSSQANELLLEPLLLDTRYFF